MQEIIGAVSSLILTKYPGYQIYLDDWQEGFARPSFSIPFIQETQTPKNKEFYARNIILYVIFHAQLGAGNNPDKANQYAVYETLRKLFSTGFFYLGKRAVKIRQLTGGPKGKEIYLGLNLDLTESQVPVEQEEMADSLQMKLEL